MKRTLLLFASCIVVILIIVLVAVFNIVGISKINGIGNSDIITRRETALRIGRALLEEHFPDFMDESVIIDAEEKDGVWRVHNVVQRQCTTENGEAWVQYGGEVYVEFRKSNGEILKIGVDE